MSLAVVWMLLFGPATEAATYVLIAVPSAYLLIAGRSEVSQSALRVVSTLSYLGFVSAHILNSWFPIKKNVYLNPRDPILLDSLLFRSALFVVEAAAA